MIFYVLYENNYYDSSFIGISGRDRCFDLLRNKKCKASRPWTKRRNTLKRILFKNKKPVIITTGFAIFRSIGVIMN
jgi:hypothetical protein